jgi:hypothetical protein
MLDDPEIRYVLSRSRSHVMGLLGRCALAARSAPLSLDTRFGLRVLCTQCHEFVVVGRMPWSRHFRGLCGGCGSEVIRAA